MTALDAAGNESAAGISNSIRTPNLFITSVSWRVPRLGWTGPAVSGGDLVINAVGEANRQAVAQVVYSYWDGSAVQQQTASIELSDEGPPGVYKGSFTLTTGTTQLTSIHAIISDGFNHYAGKDAAGLPLNVAGSLAVNVELSSDAVGSDILNNWRLMAWSSQNNNGAVATLSGPGVYTLDLAPGDDYTLSVLSNLGRKMGSWTGLTVMPGRTTETTVTPSLPATLRIRVVDQGTGEGIGNVRILMNRADGSYVYTGISSGGEGYVKNGYSLQPQDISLYSDEQIVVRMSLETQELQIRYEEPEDVVINLAPGENTVYLVLQKKKMATLQGIITDDGGIPLEGAQVVATQSLNGRSVTLIAETDINGEYSLEIMPEVTRVTFSHRATVSVAEMVTPLPDTVTVLDSTLKRRGTVMLEVYTQRAGQPEYPLDMDWRVAVHFGFTLRNITKGTRVYWSGGGTSWPAIPIDNGSPGDEIEILLNGSEAGMSNQFVTVVLDDQKMAKATMHLKELGRMQAKVRDDQGQVRQGLMRYVDVFRREGQNTSWTSGMGFSTQDITIGSLKAGEYTAVFHWRDVGRSYLLNGSWHNFISSLEDWESHLSLAGDNFISIPFTITDAEIIDLGDIALPYPLFPGQGYFQGQPGNSFTASTAEAVPGSIVTLRAGFRYAATQTYSDPRNLKLIMTVPDEASLVADSTVIKMVYGSSPAILDAGADRIELDFGNAATQPGGIEGVATYQVRLGDQPAWPSTGARAWVQYLGSGGSWYEEIGAATIKVPYITITAPGSTVTRDILVSGRAPAGVAVSVYDNGFYLGEATASNYGTWRANVVLPDLGRKAIHFLTAQFLNGEEVMTSRAVSVTYDPDKPYITSVTMYQQDGRHITFEPTKGVASFPYVYVPGMAFTFEIKFNDNDKVQNVEIRSDSGARLNAAYDAKNQVYVASGPLTSGYSYWNSGGYLPGSIYISFKNKPQPYQPAPMPPENVLRSYMSPAWRDATVTVAGSGSAGAAAFTAQANTVTFPQATIALGESGGKMNVTFSVTALPDFTPENYTAYSYEGMPTVYNLTSFIGDDANGRAHFSISAIVPMSALEPAVAQALRAQSGAEHAMVKVMGETPLDGGLGVADLYDTIKSGFDFKETMDQLGAFLDSASSCSSSHNQYYRDMADLLAQQAMTNLCIKYSMQLGGMALAATGVGAIGTIAVWGISNILTEVGNAKWEQRFNDLKTELANDEDCKRDDDDDDDDDNNDDNNDNNDDNDNSDKKDKVTDPKWILDPSGYVYEALPANRVEDVQTTILEKDPVTGELTVWDAVWYEQENPLYTDAEGRYGWDVPEGDWQVVYEKDGYETTSSEVMHVPPPRMDVNVGIVSLQPPAVKTVSAAPGGLYVDIVFDKYIRVSTVSNDTVMISVYGGESIPVPGSFTPLTQAVDPDDSSVMLANVVRFTPDSPLTVGQTYTVMVDEMVLSYAQRPMAADYEGEVTVTAAPGEDNPPPSDDDGDGGDTPPPNDPGSGSHPYSDGSSAGSVPAATGQEAFKLGSEGKTITAFGGELNLEIPAGAFGENVTLTVRKLGTPQVGREGLTPVGPIYEFDTGGVKPKNPIKVIIRYERKSLAGIDLRKLGVYRQDDQAVSRWDYVGGILDPEKGTITVTLKGFSSYAVMAYNHSFNDLQGHWSQPDVEVLVGRNLVRGVNDRQFQPDRPITRAEMAALLVQILSADPDRDTGFTPLVGSFTDVPQNVWYFASVEKAARYGLVKGSNHRFRPNDSITREEMAVMLVNAMGLADSAKADLAKGLAYTDASGISPWAADFVALATLKGIMRGDSAANFRPQGGATRAEAAVVMLRAMERMGLVYAFVTTGGTIEESTEKNGYYEIECSAGTVNYLLLPAGDDVRRQLANAAGQETEITGIAVDEPAGNATIPVLQVIAVGGKPSKPGG